MPYTTCMPHTPHTHLGIPKSINPARRPGGFAIRRKKKVRPMKTGGFVIPHNYPSITKDYLTTITSSNPLPPA